RVQDQPATIAGEGLHRDEPGEQRDGEQRRDAGGALAVDEARRDEIADDLRDVAQRAGDEDGDGESHGTGSAPGSWPSAPSSGGSWWAAERRPIATAASAAMSTGIPAGTSDEEMSASAMARAAVSRAVVLCSRGQTSATNAATAAPSRP